MEKRSFKLVKACERDGDELGVHLSDEDYKELTINKGGVYVNARIALKEAIKCSEEAYAIVNETSGVIYAVGGYTSFYTCWFMTSEYVKNFTKEERKAFALLLVEGRNIGLKAHPVLWNMIWTGNPAHIEFTKRCGARMEEERLHPNGERYVPFAFYREDFPELNQEV